MTHQIHIHSPDEIELFRASIRGFVEGELTEARVRAMDDGRALDPELRRQMARLGWLGLSLPEAYGGSAAGVEMGVVLVEEVSRVFPSLGTLLVLWAMGARAVSQHGSDHQKSQILPRMADGAYALAFGISEPDGGTDALRCKTRATRTESGWRIDGSKLYTSFAAESDAIATLCRTAPLEEGKPSRGLSVILVPRAQDGVETRRMKLMAHRAACTCETYFDDARAAADDLLGEEGQGFKQLLSTLDEERILAAAMYVGIMQGALDGMVAYARDRVAFGKQIGGFQAIQHPIADVATDLEHARLMVSHAARLFDRNEDSSNAAAMAKLFASEAAARATDRGMRVMGGYGLVQEHSMERLFRDARLGLFSPISNEMIRNQIGERLGLPRSY